jgi:putative intracellular protease/amidase
MFLSQKTAKDRRRFVSHRDSIQNSTARGQEKFSPVDFKRIVNAVHKRIMWDFDPDEWLFMILAAIAAVVFAGRYFLPVFQVWRLPAKRRAWWIIWPVVCLIPTLAVLCTLADAQVRGHPDYITMFMIGGAAWVLGAAPLLPLLGLRMRDDVIERGNPAAAIVAGAAMLASGIIYAGANIGSGATIWSTVIPALVGAGALAVAALIVRAASPLAEAVAIDRDSSSAAIFAGFLISASILLAWAVAGDFVDWDKTELDFARRGWSVIVLMCAAIVALWIARRRAAKGVRNAGS